MDKIKLAAPAKINLFLDIKNKREDGYHELVTVMQSISLCDSIEIKKKNTDSIILNCAHENLPENNENLAYQAAALIIKEAGLGTGVNIDLKKEIPVAAGLAGGSADAAAVLRGINYLYDLRYSCSRLQQMAAIIGSDVPFCVRGGTALGTGRGDKIQYLNSLAKTNLILIKPPVTVSTARIYKEFDRVQPQADIPADKLIGLIEEGRQLLWNEGWDNILEPVTSKLINEIKIIKKILYDDFDVKFCLMSGSGPTVFAVTKDIDHGQYIADNWPRSQDFVRFSVTVGQKLSKLPGACYDY